jgi:hypothetical protein
MKSFPTLTLAGIVCAISEFAYALPPSSVPHPIPRGAPGPEIGNGLIGATIATVAVLAFVLYPRLLRWRQSKQY